ncbi:MAG: RluA family pseudouridine synthase [Dictyoglomus thermophilum]|uniref:Pseudouridine synthase n=1 Tax=Dictyoglomus thermophilum TaxID=14 RepID=A0A7C2GWZ5_DICTH|nr:RluA family pseudouridine synthase [Dictyoglomus thermophilum]MCX7721163.1 RluA family pseudouridine synthase [Dictyoglomus thermophilum]
MADFLNLEVIYEDNHLLVVNKPAGILVQGDITKSTTLLEISKAYIKEKYKKPGNVFLAIVHRLDKPVSGVVVFARNSKSAGRLSEAFRERKVEKEYIALCKGIFKVKKGTISESLLWVEKERKARVSQDDKSKNAITHYEVLEEFKNLSLVRLIPETGRKHQLRAHLSYIGHPILGDEKYGGGRIFKDRIFLHCKKMAVPHPVRKDIMEFEAKIPDFWSEFLKVEI